MFREDGWFKPSKTATGRALVVGGGGAGGYGTTGGTNPGGGGGDGETVILTTRWSNMIIALLAVIIYVKVLTTPIATLNWRLELPPVVLDKRPAIIK